jgi:hypothetical protein
VKSLVFKIQKAEERQGKFALTFGRLAFCILALLLLSSSVFASNLKTDFSVVASWHTTIPGTNYKFTFFSGAPVVDKNGTVFFAGGIRTSTINHYGIYKKKDGIISKVIDSNDRLPNGELFQGFDSAYSQITVANGRIAFRARLGLGSQTWGIITNAGQSSESDFIIVADNVNDPYSDVFFPSLSGNKLAFNVKDLEGKGSIRVYDASVEAITIPDPGLGMSFSLSYATAQASESTLITQYQADPYLYELGVFHDNSDYEMLIRKDFTVIPGTENDTIKLFDGHPVRSS